jgi:hypothetical protein
VLIFTTEGEASSTNSVKSGKLAALANVVAVKIEKNKTMYCTTTDRDFNR